MSVISLDTQLLYWAIIQRPPMGHEHVLGQVTRFLKWTVDNEHKVIVPSIVLSELLIGVPYDKQKYVLAQVTAHYRIVPFDLKASAVFAKMRRDHLIKHRLDDLLNPDILHATRGALKADIMIIATAIAHGADILYSYDDKLRRLADSYITARNFTDELD
ncbi:MAG: PIN domain-containing protein [Chloroflexota bacterium]